jgi:hypothetical protein
MTSLVAIRRALESSNSEHATFFTTLIENRNLGPYKSKETAKRKLGSKDIEYPVLGKKQAPMSLRKSYTTEDLHDICSRDVSEARTYFGDRFIYSMQSGAADDIMNTNKEDAGMRAIHNVNDTDNCVTNAIVTFPSETLEEACCEGWEAPKDLLRVTTTTCTVLPGNTLLPLQHSNESTTVATLLQGSIIWISWPPTDNNLHSLQTAYENFGKELDQVDLGIASNLEGGMVFMQTEGDGLRLPPFSLTMSLATTTSVLATYCEVTIKDFIVMLQKMPLLKAWFQTELDGDRKQTKFNASIVLYLDLMLNGDADNEGRNNLKLPYVKGGQLDAILEVWDDVKDDVAAIMGPDDRKKMENIWTKHLIAAGGRHCRICDKHIRNKQKLMRNHFIESHWCKAEDIKRVESFDEARNAERTTNQAEQIEVNGDERDGSMGVDE